MKWISVKERLPPLKQGVLAYGNLYESDDDIEKYEYDPKQNEIEIAWLNCYSNIDTKILKWWTGLQARHESHYIMLSVEWWMPLPEEPNRN